jgi:dihydropteroate synthase
MMQEQFQKHNRTLVMGVLNVTPDSFSDGGCFYDPKDAVKRAISMARDGADIIDIGGESTRPGASRISTKEEIDRVVPVIRAISKKLEIPISIDTRSSPVALEAIRAGASIINDVSGFSFDPEMARVVARHKVYVILMHSKGTPDIMQKNPVYKDVVNEIYSSLGSKVALAVKAGIKKERIILDPGIGFGKTVKHNIEILNRLDEICAMGFPVCVGVSRKSFIGKILDIKDPMDRLTGSIASSVFAIIKGARIVRTHDVRETVEASRITDSLVNI